MTACGRPLEASSLTDSFAVAQWRSKQGGVSNECNGQAAADRHRPRRADAASAECTLLAQIGKKNGLADNHLVQVGWDLKQLKGLG